MIELYIFDQGGVLSRDFDIGPEAARRLGLPLPEFRALAAPDLMPFMRGEIDSAEFWRRFEARSGLRAAEDYWRTLFRPRLDGETVKLVRELSRGARTVSGTNTIAVHHEINLALGHHDAVQAVYASHLMGFAKPEPEFWLAILEAEGVAPGRAFFVDDYPENVEAARSLGLEARLYVSAAELRRGLCALGAPVSPVAPVSLASPVSPAARAGTAGGR